MQSRITGWALGVLVAVFLAGAAWVVWQRLAPPAASPGIESAAPAEPATSEPAPTDVAPAIQHPVDGLPVASGPAGPSVPPAPSGDPVLDSLRDLLGREALLRYVNTDAFVRRVVATVDNLPRDQAPSRLWPVVPAPGRLALETRDGQTFLAASNATRHEPIVRFAEGVDLRAAAAWYVRHYARFQSAYEELGFPGRYFNDRMVAVVDHLLATPEPTGPVALRLPEIQGPVQPARPWVMYEYADPALQRLSAGQKLLLRLSDDQRARLKQLLTQWRELVTAR
jgi:hypothetical protein